MDGDSLYCFLYFCVCVCKKTRKFGVDVWACADHGSVSIAWFLFSSRWFHFASLSLGWQRWPPIIAPGFHSIHLATSVISAKVHGRCPLFLIGRKRLQAYLWTNHSGQGISVFLLALRFLTTWTENGARVVPSKENGSVVGSGSWEGRWAGTITGILFLSRAEEAHSSRWLLRHSKVFGGRDQQWTVVGIQLGHSRGEGGDCSHARGRGAYCNFQIRDGGTWDFMFNKRKGWVFSLH